MRARGCVNEQGFCSLTSPNAHLASSSQGGRCPAIVAALSAGNGDHGMGLDGLRSAPGEPASSQRENPGSAQRRPRPADRLPGPAGRGDDSDGRVQGRRPAGGRSAVGRVRLRPALRRDRDAPGAADRPVRRRLHPRDWNVRGRPSRSALPPSPRAARRCSRPWSLSSPWSSSSSPHASRCSGASSRRPSRGRS